MKVLYHHYVFYHDGGPDYRLNYFSVMISYICAFRWLNLSSALLRTQFEQLGSVGEVRVHEQYPAEAVVVGTNSRHVHGRNMLLMFDGDLRAALYKAC